MKLEEKTITVKELLKNAAWTPHPDNTYLFTLEYWLYIFYACLHVLFVIVSLSH